MDSLTKYTKEDIELAFQNTSLQNLRNILNEVDGNFAGLRESEFISESVLLNKNTLKDRISKTSIINAINKIKMSNEKYLSKGKLAKIFSELIEEGSI